MTPSFYPRSNLKILSQRFRELRIANNYSLRGIARSENIAHTVISNIETGKIYPNIITLKSLYMHIDIDLLTDEKECLKFYEELKTFKDAVYFNEFDMARTIFIEIKKSHVQLHNSLLYVDYMLSLLLYEVVVEENYTPQELLTLEEYQAYFSEHQKQEYNLIVAAAYYWNDEINKAENRLLKNLDLYADIKSHAMTLTYLSNIYKRKFNLHNAIDYALKASELHAEQANIIEKVRSDILAANMLILIKRFDEGLKLLNTIQVSVLPDEPKLEFVRRDMNFLWSYFYFKKEDYKKAFELLEKYTTKESLLIPSYYYYKAEILSNLKRVESCKNLLEAALKTECVEKDEIYSRLISIYLWDISEDYKHPNFKSYVNYLLNAQNKIEDFSIFKHVHQISIRYYTSYKDYKQALNTALNFMNSIEQ